MNSAEKFFTECCIERLLAGLDLRQVPIKGRVKAIADKTGYSSGMVSKVLSGKVSNIERFVKVVCNKYDIDERYVYGQDFPPLLNISREDDYQENDPANGKKMFIPMDLLELMQDGQGVVILEALAELKKMTEPMRLSLIHI